MSARLLPTALAALLCCLLLAGCAGNSANHEPETTPVLPFPPPPPLDTEFGTIWDQWLDVRALDPPIISRLRYATANNITGRPLYRPDMPPILRVPTAQKLEIANRILLQQGFQIVVWDAFRPTETQYALWEAVPVPNFVGNPHKGTSLHASGIAVDVTLADLSGRLLPMPSDFDEFGPQAHAHYKGGNSLVAFHLKVLQSAMTSAGLGIYPKEWWHFYDTEFGKNNGRFARSARSLGIPLPSSPAPTIQ